MINFRVIPPRPGGKIVPTRPQTEYIFALVGRLKLTALNDRVGKTQCTREEFLLKIELTYRMFRLNSQYMRDAENRTCLIIPRGSKQDNIEGKIE